MIGHEVSDETIAKIKAARVAQDEDARVAAVRQWAQDHPEEMRTRMSRETKVLGGKAVTGEVKAKAGRAGAAAGGPKARHVRWHVNRKQMNPACTFCVPPVYLIQERKADSVVT